MGTILPYVYVGVPCLLIGAVFGAFWGRKHPAIVNAAAAAADAAKKAAG